VVISQPLLKPGDRVGYTGWTHRHAPALDAGQLIL